MFLESALRQLTMDDIGYDLCAVSKGEVVTFAELSVNIHLADRCGEPAAFSATRGIVSAHENESLIIVEGGGDGSLPGAAGTTSESQRVMYYGFLDVAVGEQGAEAEGFRAGELSRRVKAQIAIAGVLTLTPAFLRWFDCRCPVADRRTKQV